MMKIFRYISFSTIMTLSLLSLSCKKKQIETVSITKEIPSNYSWYYFSEGTFKKTEKVQLAPRAVEKPWTEAVRISSCGLEEGNNYENPRGFACVNQYGMLLFQGDKINLYTDSEIFKGRTAENLVFANGIPVFSVYRSTFFNESKTEVQQTHPFLVQFNPQQKVFYTMINVENLGLEAKSEITDFIYDGQFWTCSIKSDGPEKVDFSYLTFQTKEDITLLTPYNADKMLFITESDVDSYRNTKKPIDFSKAPERLINLLQSLPEKMDFSVSLQTVQSHSPRTYTRIKKTSLDGEVLAAKAIISDTWIACLFEDGTIYINGALFEKNIMNKGKTMGIKLPRLPANFKYGDFVITGTSLYAAWEESSFYKTKRSGFISVNLEEILYQR